MGVFMMEGAEGLHRKLVRAEKEDVEGRMGRYSCRYEASKGAVGLDSRSPEKRSQQRHDDGRMRALTIGPRCGYFGG